MEYGSDELCFCCADLVSMEVIHLSCCKANVHRQCVLDALQSNNQFVYCRKVLDPQNIIDCTPKCKAFSVEAKKAQTTTLSEVKAAQEAIMSGDANVSQQTPAVPGLKAPPEANMSQKQIAANMNPPNINLEQPIHDEVMNLHKKPVDGKERSLSSTPILGENDNNGLLFAPTCTTCFNENKYLMMSEKKCSYQWTNECLNRTGEYIIFPSEMYHHGYYNQKSNQIFTQVQLFYAPTNDTNVL
jgi:hypothetical protein